MGKKNGITFVKKLGRLSQLQATFPSPFSVWGSEGIFAFARRWAKIRERQTIYIITISSGMECFYV
jgi:hypothetical protein